MCSLNSQISPASKNPAPICHESAKSLRTGESLITSPHHGYCDVFFVGNVLESFRFWATWRTLRNLDDYVLSGNQYCMTKHGSSYPQIVYRLRVSVVWNYPLGWAHLKCSRSSRNWWSSSFLSARQIAQKRKLSKTFHTKKHIAIPTMRGNDKRLTWP